MSKVRRAATAAPVAAAPVAAAPGFKVVQGVVLPPPAHGGGGKTIYPFETMLVNAMFFVPYGDKTAKQVMNRMAGAITRAQKNVEAKFAARHWVDNDNLHGFGANVGGIGVWRTA